MSVSDGVNYNFFHHRHSGLRSMFCIVATFEMRTVLYGIRLLIDDLEMVGRVFISNIESGEESKTA
jgi:hypothetical protein